ncbi:glycosyltransferase, partial [Pseudoxanthomonas sp. SGD-10]
ISLYASQGVKLIRLQETEKLNSYKKKAIAEAIKIASGELIVTTDADCRMGDKWLKTIVGCFEQNGYHLISSPVAYFQERNAFEEMQTLEFSFLIGLGASGIGSKMPSTCNGANLAYRKSIFFEVEGFKGIDDLASGDDELLLHKVAAKYPDKIGFCKSTDAIVYTTAKENLREFIKQRKRWASKSTKYKNKALVFVAVCVWLFNLSFLINLISGLFMLNMFKLFLVQYIFKIFAELYFLKEVTSFNRRAELLRYLPILTIFHSIYMVFIGVAGNTGKYDWKGRMVK